MKKSILALLFCIFTFISLKTSASPAIEAFEKRDYTLAKNLLLEMPSNAETNYYLGRIAFAQGELEDAVDLLEKALEANSTNPEYHFWFARTSARLASNASIFSAPGYASDAREHFEQALKLDEKYAEAMIGLFNFYLQAPAIAGGSDKKALAMLDKLTPIAPELALISRVNYYREKDDLDNEIAAAKKLMSQFPDSARALTKAGFSYQLSEQYDVAFDLFKKATLIKNEEQQGSIHSALYQLGRTAVLSEKNTQQGIEALEKYLTLNLDAELPSKEWAKFRLASLYSAAGKQQQARKLITEVIQNTEDKTLKRRAKFLLKKIS